MGASTTRRSPGAALTQALYTNAICELSTTTTHNRDASKTNNMRRTIVPQVHCHHWRLNTYGVPNKRTPQLYLRGPGDRAEAGKAAKGNHALNTD